MASRDDLVYADDTAKILAVNAIHCLTQKSKAVLQIHHELLLVVSSVHRKQNLKKTAYQPQQQRTYHHTYMRFRLLLIFSFNLHSLPSLFSVFNTLRRVHVHGSLTGHAAVYDHSTQFSMQTETDTHTQTDSVYPFVVNIDCWSKTRSQFACCLPPSWICHTIFGHPWWTHGSCAPRLHEYLCRCMRQYHTEKTNRAGTNAFEVKCYRHAYVFTV